eukprot:scaffold7349_cov173-Amphora_coffeaeformis.AAC.142
MRKSQYGSTDTSKDAQGDAGDASTPKISHILRKRTEAQAAATAQHHPTAIAAHGSFQQYAKHDSTDDDQESLLSFRTLTPPGSPKEGGAAGTHGNKNSYIFDFGSFASKLSWRKHERNTANDDSVRTNRTLQSVVGDSVRTVVSATFRLPGKPCDIRQGTGTASAANEIFNLWKNLVGAGALGLPSGIAAFANAPSGVYPACIIIVLMGTIFAYYFFLVGRICQHTGTASYREAWELTVGGSGGSAALVALFVLLMAGLGNLAYSMILADTTKSLLLTVGLTLTRTQCLVLVTVIALWPLCLVKELHVLAPFSMLGMAGIFFTVVVMAWRYFDGTYNVGGYFYDSQDVSPNLLPSFGGIGASGAWSWKILLLVCMNYQSWFCHYNSPRYFIELENNTLPRFGCVVATSFSISALLYVAMAAFGFLTFGSQCSGFILNNYSTNDKLATICRVAIAGALIFTYPLPFLGCRDGILDLLMVPTSKRTSQNLNVLTLVQLGLITLLAMHFKDLGMVNAVGGALFGTAVVFIFPTLMFCKVAEEDSSKRHEARFAIVLMCLGIGLGATGVLIAVMGADG